MGSKKATDCIPFDIDPYMCEGVLQIPKPAVNNGTAALQTDSSLDSAYGSQNVDSSLPVRSTSSYFSLKRHQTDEDSGVFSAMTFSIKIPVEGGEDPRTLTPSPGDYSTRSTDDGDLSEVSENTATLAQDHYTYKSEKMGSWLKELQLHDQTLRYGHELILYDHSSSVFEVFLWPTSQHI